MYREKHETGTRLSLPYLGEPRLPSLVLNDEETNHRSKPDVMRFDPTPSLRTVYTTLSARRDARSDRQAIDEETQTSIPAFEFRTTLWRLWGCRGFSPTHVVTRFRVERNRYYREEYMKFVWKRQMREKKGQKPQLDMRAPVRAR